MISRRKFLRRGSLWLPASFCFPAILRGVPPLRNPGYLASVLKAPSGGGPTCPAEGVTPDVLYDTGGTVTLIPFAFDANRNYAGQLNWSPASGTKQICRVGFGICKATSGDPVGTLVARIWTVGGSSALGTELANSPSGAVTPSFVTDPSWAFVTFQFSDFVSVSAGTNYCITVNKSDNSVASDNYPEIAIGDGGSVTGSYARWATDKSFYYGDTQDAFIKIWYAS